MENDAGKYREIDICRIVFNSYKKSDKSRRRESIKAVIMFANSIDSGKISLVGDGVDKISDVYTRKGWSGYCGVSFIISGFEKLPFYVKKALANHTSIVICCY